MYDIGLFLWQSQKLTSKAMCAIKQVKKPSGACAQKLAELYPASKHTPVKRLGEAFDPLQECVALPFKKAKKSSRVKPVTLEFIILPHSYSLVLPKGKKRQQLKTEGRVKYIPIKRTMSPLQLRNAIVSGFNHLNVDSWEFLEASGGKLVKCENQDLGGDIVQRRGAVYLIEKVCRSIHMLHVHSLNVCAGVHTSILMSCVIIGEWERANLVLGLDDIYIYMYRRCSTQSHWSI